MEIADLDELGSAKAYALQNNDKSLLSVVSTELQKRVDSDRHDTMVDRLSALDESMKRLDKKEWKAVLFWIGVATFFITSAALLRDVVDWTIFGFENPAPKHQEPITNTSEPTQQAKPIPVSDPVLSPSPAAPKQ